MGTTSNGYPYPEPTDPVSEGADAIRALAEALPPALIMQRSGSSGLNTTTTASGRLQIRFPMNFAAGGRPLVMFNFLTPSPPYQWRFDSINDPGGIGIDKFTLGVYSGGSSVGNQSVACVWYAIGLRP